MPAPPPWIRLLLGVGRIAAACRRRTGESRRHESVNRSPVPSCPGPWPPLPPSPPPAAHCAKSPCPAGRPRAGDHTFCWVGGRRWPGCLPPCRSVLFYWMRVPGGEDRQEGPISCQLKACCARRAWAVFKLQPSPLGTPAVLPVAHRPAGRACSCACRPTHACCSLQAAAAPTRFPCSQPAGDRSAAAMFGKQAYGLLQEVAQCPADNLPTFNVREGGRPAAAAAAAARADTRWFEVPQLPPAAFPDAHSDMLVSLMCCCRRRCFAA